MSLVSPDISPFMLFIAAIFTGNILLTNFLGLCSFLAISKDIKSANGLGLAVVVVAAITAFLNWIVYYYFLVPFGLEYLQYIVFIIVVAAVVQLLEMLLDRLAPSLYAALGIFLPLITVNCAIFGIVLFMIIRDYSLSQSVAYGLGGGLGWWLAIVALAAIRKKTEKARIPSSLQGFGLTLITIGFMAMGFMGFSGMIPVQ